MGLILVIGNKIEPLKKKKKQGEWLTAHCGIVERSNNTPGTVVEDDEEEEEEVVGVTEDVNTLEGSGGMTWKLEQASWKTLYVSVGLLVP